VCTLQVVQAHGPGVKLSSVHDGQPVLQGVRCLALRCNNTELVSGGSDGRICIHDVTGDKLGSILQTLQVRRVATNWWGCFASVTGAYLQRDRCGTRIETGEGTAAALRWLFLPPVQWGEVVMLSRLKLYAASAAVLGSVSMCQTPVHADMRQ
jgi:hypothetical protein